MADPEPTPIRVLPIRCPVCDSLDAELLINSYTVLTLKCRRCSHTWSADVSALSAHVQEQLCRIP
jgi:phage FluMu protein Com